MVGSSPRISRRAIIQRAAASFVSAPIVAASLVGRPIVAMAMASQALPVFPAYAPSIKVFGVGGAGCHVIDHMVQSGMAGVELIVADTDTASLEESRAKHRIALGHGTNGCDSHLGQCRAVAEASLAKIQNEISGAEMVFIAAGMGGSTAAGAAPVIASAAREQGVLTVGVVSKPFHFEGEHRMRNAEAAIEDLSQHVDGLIIIPSQSMFRNSQEPIIFADAFRILDAAQSLGVQAIFGNLLPDQVSISFSDVSHELPAMGKNAIGFGESYGENRAANAAEKAILNPFLDQASPEGARSIFINVTGGDDMTLFEVDDACCRIHEYAGARTNIVIGATFDKRLNGKMRVTMLVSHDRA